VTVLALLMLNTPSRTLFFEYANRIRMEYRTNYLNWMCI